MPLIDPGDGVHAERPAGEAVDDAAGQQRLIGAIDGGVSRRLVRRCRTAASILLVIGAGLLLGVALAPWGVISASLSLAAAILIAGSLLLLRRGALWSEVAGSFLRDATPDPAGLCSPGRSAGSGAEGSPVVPGAAATIGPPRPLSSAVASAPVKRRLSSAVVPIYADDDGPSPGDGALVVHARADGMVLTEGDRVLVWCAGNRGLTSMPGIAGGTRPAFAFRGRFVLYRESDDEVFLATTRLADTW